MINSPNAPQLSRIQVKINGFHFLVLRGYYFKFESIFDIKSKSYTVQEHSLDHIRKGASTETQDQASSFDTAILP